MSEYQKHTPHSGVAGVSAGTALIGMFSQLNDGGIKNMLLLLAPTITIVVSFFWNSFWDEVQQHIADRRIRSQRKKHEQLVKRLNEDPAIPKDVRKKAQDELNALRLLEVELAQKRVRAIVASTETTPSMKDPVRKGSAAADL